MQTVPEIIGNADGIPEVAARMFVETAPAYGFTCGVFIWPAFGARFRMMVTSSHALSAIAQLFIIYIFYILISVARPTATASTKLYTTVSLLETDRNLENSKNDCVLVVKLDYFVIHHHREVY